jgi:phytoene desaturase
MTARKPFRVVVIGSGFGGLAAAIRLQSRGAQVTLLEQRERTGGRAYQLQEAGYTFDMGPSLITAPDVIARVFARAGKRLEDALELRALDPFYRVFFHDRTRFEYNGSPEGMKAQMRRYNAADADRYDAFMAAIAPIYSEVIEKGLGSRPFGDPRTMLRFAPTALRLGAWRTATGYANRFFKDWRHRFVFSFHSLYIGGNPFHCPAIYQMIPYLERAQGVWYSPGGMRSLVSALETTFVEAGGVVKTSTPATRIRIEQERGVGCGRAVGVETPDEFYPADVVVSNADVGFTYARLIDPAHRRKWTDRRVNKQEYTMSCFLLFLGVKKRYPELAHHTLILAERYRELLKDIFQRKVLPEDFSMYLHAPTRSDDGMAPPGCESLMVLIPVANQKSGIDWKREAGPYAEKILDFLENWGLKDLRANLEVRRVFTPDDFESQLSAWQGNAFGLEPRLSQTGYFRPHNRSEDVKGLYFTGAGTHPGAGVPGVMLSAEAAETCIVEDFPAFARGDHGLEGIA